MLFARPCQNYNYGLWDFKSLAYWSSADATPWGGLRPHPPLRNMRGSAPQTPRMKYNVCQIKLEKCWALLQLARAKLKKS